jgi:hypothetical protein
MPGTGLAGGQGKLLSATCRCGKVEIALEAAPVLVAGCYCTSCQRAGQAFEAMASAPPVLDADGGTPYVICRKDRVRFVRGREKLQAYLLKPGAPTRRVMAVCCNSAMFADFTPGHWLSLYRKRFGAGAPPVEMRVMTAERRADVVLGNEVPNHAGRSGHFMWKLIAAWAAMSFRKPDLGLAQIPHSIFDNE